MPHWHFRVQIIGVDFSIISMRHKHMKVTKCKSFSLKANCNRHAVRECKLVQFKIFLIIARRKSQHCRHLQCMNFAVHAIQFDVEENIFNIIEFKWINIEFLIFFHFNELNYDNVTISRVFIPKIRCSNRNVDLYFRFVSQLCIFMLCFILSFFFCF